MIPGKTNFRGLHRRKLADGREALPFESPDEIADFVQAGLGQEKGFVSVEVSSGHKLHQPLLFEVFDRAGGVGGLATEAIESDVKGAGIEKFDVLTIFKEGPEENAFRAVEFQVRVIEKLANGAEIIGGFAVLPLP